MLFCVFPGSMGRPSEGGVQKLMMPSLLFFDAFSDHACVFLCVSMYLEAELLTHEDIPMQCAMTTQEWMATQYDQASDTCMANRLNMRGNPTAHRTQPSLPASHALAPCARQPGFRARQALLYKPFFSLQSLRYTSQDMRSEKHCTFPFFVRTTHESQSVGQPGQSTTSIESSKVKNPNPMLHLIQHHLALLHASSQGNDRIGSSDLLDSGG